MNVRAGWQELVSPAHGEAPEALPRSPRRPPHSLGSPQEPLDDFGRWIRSCPLGSLRTVSIPAWEGPSPGPRPGYVPEGTARVSLWPFGSAKQRHCQGSGCLLARECLPLWGRNPLSFPEQLWAQPTPMWGWGGSRRAAGENGYPAGGTAGHTELHQLP